MSDLIKREDAIKVIWAEGINPSEDGMVFEVQSHIDRDIRLIPAADSEVQIIEAEAYIRGIDSERKRISDWCRPQGKWIDDEFLGKYRCSECDYYSVDEFDYCPNCGARMFAKDTIVPNKKGEDDE